MTQDWKVLLLGGGTATGKTEPSLKLGRRYEARVVEGDDLRWLIEAAVPMGSDPDLHLFLEDDVWRRTEQDLLDRTLRLSARLCKATEAILARHHAVDDRLIIEAFWILPEFASQTVFNGVDMRCEVRSLFLHEPNFQELRTRRAQRLTSIDSPARLSMFAAHGARIQEQAEAKGLPVLSSQPFETLEARAVEAIEGACYRRTQGRERQQR